MAFVVTANFFVLESRNSMFLPGFQQRETLYRGRVHVVRATRDSDGRRVVIKILPADGDAPAERARLGGEYRTLCALQQAWPSALVAQPLEFIDTTLCALVLEDIGGYSLSACLDRADKSLCFAEILHIAQQSAQALAGVHQARIVHKDVNPNNIVFNAATGQVQLIDFGMSTVLPREMQGVQHVRRLEGTVAYMPPEQTGRTNDPLDYRADLYSLGATLFHLLAGQAPFVDSELTALVYAILTQVPPQIVKPDLPPALHTLVRKLLAKSPEQRYQSAYGVHQDLARIATEYEQHILSDFSVGAHDRVECFEMPHKLYGREAQARSLGAAWTAVEGGAKTLIVLDGPAGIGKSSIVQAFQPAITQKRGLYAAGKFEQLNRRIPFAAFAQVVEAVVRHILAEDAATLEGWRRRVQLALGDIGQALIDVAPALERLVGPQKPLMPLPPLQTDNRLTALLQRFIRCVAAQQPLVMFFDDIQWADAGTLRVLDDILRDAQAGSGVLLIAACRRNELDVTDPVWLQLKRWDDTPGLSQHITITPLDKNALADLLRDVLRSAAAAEDHADIAALTDLLHRKTEGNAFFVGEFLKHLWSQSLINYDPAKGAWTWDLRGIMALQVTDNVVDLLAGRLSELPQSTQRLVSLAACIGTDIDLQLLQTLEQTSASYIEEHLLPAVHAGLLMPQRQKGSEATMYRFAHDRVLQACYARLPPEVAKQYHWRIGGWALHEQAETHGMRIFAAVDQLNRAHDLPQAMAQKDRLVQLNLTAGRNAKGSGAYGPAYSYLEVAADIGSDLPTLAREITLELIDCDYLLGRFERAETRLKDLFAGAENDAERVALLTRQGNLLIATDRNAAGSEALLGALRLAGLPLPSHPSVARVAIELFKTRRFLRNFTEEQLIALPDITDEAAAARLAVLEALSVVAFTSGENNLYALTQLHITGIVLHYGKTPLSIETLSTAAAFIMAAFGDKELVKRVATAARKLTDLTPLAMESGAVMALVWHLYERHEALYRRGEANFHRYVQNGGFMVGQYVGSAAMTFYTPLSLDLTNSINDQVRALSNVRQNPIGETLGKLVEQLAAVLRGKTLGPHTLSDGTYDEEKAIQQYDESSTPLLKICHRSYVLISACIMRQFERCEGAVKDLLRFKFVEAIGGGTNVGVMVAAFFAALAQTQGAHDRGLRHLPNRRRWRYWQRRIKWFSAAGPDIYGGLIDILNADLAAFDGRVAVAIAGFEGGLAAIEKCGRRDIIGFAYECAGRFYLRIGAWRAASGYLAQARATYHAWGATAKVDAMTLEFATVLSAITSSAAGVESSATKSTATTRGTAESDPDLDLMSILEAVQGLSGEVNADRLMGRLMQSLLSSTGADRAVLLLEENGLVVVARQEAGQDKAALSHDMLATVNDVPSRLVQFVARTRECVVLHTVAQGPFAVDPYFATRQPESILCAPIVGQGKVLGLVYLENTLTRAALGQSTRLRVVQLLASQTAIALQHVALYTELETHVQSRTRELQLAQQRVVTMERDSTEGRMAGGFAHEMRNALMAARTLSEHVIEQEYADGKPLLEHIEALLIQLSDSVQDDKGKHVLLGLIESHGQVSDILRTIEGSTGRAMRLTRTIMDYSRLGAERPGADAVDVGTVLARLVSDLEPSCAQHCIRVETAIAADCRLLGSESHIESMFSNLLLNARDALSQSPGARRLEVNLQHENGTYAVMVRDTGVGMTPDVQANLGAPFFSTKGPNGTGLGVATVRKLVTLYQGTLDVQSQEGAGTTLTVRLPATPQPQPR